MFKWQTGNTDMTNLLQLTISLQKSHQNQHTLQPTCKGRTFFIWADIHISSCGQQHPKCEPAIRLMYPPLFCKLHSSSNPTNKNLTRFGLEIQTSLSRWSIRIWNLFLWIYFPSPHNDRYSHLPKYWLFFLIAPGICLAILYLQF